MNVEQTLIFGHTLPMCTK